MFQNTEDAFLFSFLISVLIMAIGMVAGYEPAAWFGRAMIATVMMVVVFKVAEFQPRRLICLDSDRVFGFSLNMMELIYFLLGSLLLLACLVGVISALYMCFLLSI